MERLVCLSALLLAGLGWQVPLAPRAVSTVHLIDSAGTQTGLEEEDQRRPPQYTPDWDSLDSRPLPDWFDGDKIGVFIHWGVYSVPSIASEWFWIDWKGNPSPNKRAQKEIEDFMKTNYKPGFTYQDFAKDLTGEFFNATEWAEIIAASGARYVVLTSKHHDGFALWPSKYSYSWNSVDTGLHRDIIDELSSAVRKRGMRFGLYHSLYEWFHPLYLADKANNFTTQDFVNQKIYPELMELVIRYSPEVIWSDGEWEATSEYWRSREFLAWLYNDSPVRKEVLTNDRWGSECLCKHGGYLTCSDRYTPGKLQPRKWENALTIDRHTWGYSRKSNLNDYLSIQELVDITVQTIALGGNILMNVGPSKDGKINPIFQERLAQIGSWLKVNGEGIYQTKPWHLCQNDTATPHVWYTVSGEDLYVIFLRWPKYGSLSLSCPFQGNSKLYSATLLGLPGVELTGITEKQATQAILISKPHKQMELCGLHPHRISRLHSNGESEMQSEATEDVKERWEIPVKTEPELDLEVPEELLQVKEEPLASGGENMEPLKKEVKEEVKQSSYQGDSAELVGPLALSEDRRFCCHHCGYGTAEFNILKEHILAREGNECPVSCPYCTFSCAQSASLKAHILNIHGDPRVLFCPHCDFRCALPSALKWHIHVSHDIKRRYSCPHCDYTGARSSHLKRHIQAIHEWKRPYYCPHCDYTCSQSSNLNVHILARHEGKRPYSCSHCDYTCAQSSSLKVHILARHEGKKPYSCSQCDIRFAQSSHLKRHIQAIHEWKRPYSCPHCDYTCSRSSQLRKHILARHEGK